MRDGHVKKLSQNKNRPCLPSRYNSLGLAGFTPKPTWLARLPRVLLISQNGKRKAQRLPKIRGVKVQFTPYSACRLGSLSSPHFAAYIRDLPLLTDQNVPYPAKFFPSFHFLTVRFLDLF